MILVMGDSLSAEYGIRRGAGWVDLLKERLVERKFNWRVVNASVSGETTSGGLARLPALLQKERPAIVIIELGANDGLRGLRIAEMQHNLAAMIEAVHRAHARVVLVSMRIPPNYGRDYAGDFARAYAELGKHPGVVQTPFLFEGLADRLDMFQADRIHPVEAAQPRLLENIWPDLLPMLRMKH